ncbi:MAG: sugar phosphate isomerase/epimerase [Bacteroidales bacterium]|jgi:sugar phosphate isomerase/epimerase|nr:sugar phosphate isomerase/epimerase [Bacteroidales bacterium]
MKKTLNLCHTIFLLLLATVLISCNQKKQLGIATYSVRGIESDIEGSFRSLAEDGYVVMEISNYNPSEGKVAGYSPADYAALAEKSGLDIISSHINASLNVEDPDGTLAEWGKIFDDHKDMGCKYVVLPMNFWSNNAEGLLAECELMNRIGEEANKRGLKFGYHNHSMEFVNVPGTDLKYEDFLIENTDPDKVFFELDVFWTVFGKQDPVEYLKKYPDRIRVLHIKDDYVIGESGNIDFAAIFDQFYRNGHKDWFVEMEEKMTPESRAMTEGMMQMFTDIMLKGGPNPFAPQPPAGRPGDSLEQEGSEQQAPPPIPGFEPQTPEVIAMKLKESLEGISQSAEFLRNADFVK